MIKRSWIAPYLAIIFFLFLPSAVKATDNEFSRSSLKGISDLYVLVESLNPSIKEEGLSEDQIRTDVELKLRLAGIKIVSEKDKFNIPGFPWLYVRVGGFRAKETHIFPLHISLSLNQDVFLVREPSLTISADTWSTDFIAITGSRDISKIRDTVKDLTDHFINAYLSVNPKK